MSLLAILDAIREKGKAQICEIEVGIDSQIHEIMLNARSDGKKILEEARALSISPAFSKRAEILHHARLKALQTIGNTRESMVDAALEQTRRRLASIRTDQVYPEVLGRLVEEAITELLVSLNKPSECWLEADPRDQTLLVDILSEKRLNTKISYPLNTWGGVLAKSQDNRVVVINTLEARMERSIPSLRQYLAVFFENVPDKVAEKLVA